MIRISVIIPTLDRTGPLVACLDALTAKFPPDAETIVVSDGGEQDLRPVLARFVEPLRLRFIETAHAGQSAARNRGLEVAKGEIAAFTDDDCRPGPGWLAALAAGVRLSPPRAVGGATRNGLPENPYADAAQLVLDLLSRHDRALAHRERLLPSNNFAFPVEALRRIGGFDESYRTAEDRELCRRWAAAGFELGRVPAAVVAHDTQLDLAGFVRKFVAYGKGAAKFHGSGANTSLRESVRFHLRLPLLLVPELRRRRPARAAAVVALVVLWELANIAGFVVQMLRRSVAAPAATPGATAAATSDASETLRGATAYTTPRVSVVVPTRNRRALLERALASLDAQRFRDFEVLVVDDASDDGTTAWLRETRPAIRVLEMARPVGAAFARNRAVALARGDVVAFLDDDDCWHPAFLDAQIAQLDAHPEAELATTGHVEVDASGRVSRPDLRPLFAYRDPLVRLLAECPIHTMSVVACRRAAFARIGDFDEKLDIVHDLEWYLRLAIRGGKLVHCPDALVERGVPGGLVSRHRRWFAEERGVHRRTFAVSPPARRHWRRVRATRALLFARVGLAKGDLGFGLARLAEAFAVAPLDATRIVALRLLRRFKRERRDATEAWSASTAEAR